VFPLGAAGVGNTGVPNPKWMLFAPRGGFAWSPGSSTRTVIRGGFGWAYNRINISPAVNAFENALTRKVDFRQTSLTTLSSPTNLNPIAAQSFGVRDEASRHVPTVYDFSLSVQRELPFSTILDVAYIGNLQRHQSISFNINQIPLGASWDPKYVRPGVVGSNFFGPVNASNPGALPGTNTVDNILMRPYTGFNNLTMNVNAGNLAYHSLQVSANKRFSHGFTAQTAYTLSRLESGIENVGPYYYNWKDYTGGLAGGDGGDRRHVLTLNYTYDIPGIARLLKFDNPVGRMIFNGWRMGHLFTFVSGQRVTPGLGSIQQANTTTNVPDLSKIFLGTPDVGNRLVVSGDPYGISTDDAHLFDPKALSIPGFFPGFDGTGDRNFLTRPASYANDMTLTKAFTIRENHAFELRAAFYNAFNQVRRNEMNTSLQFKAQGRTLADGFRLFNTPDDLVTRNPNLTGTALYNQYRQGVGHINLQNVQPMRVIEIGLKYRF
jgi:hypothetical protein